MTKGNSDSSSIQQKLFLPKNLIYILIFLCLSLFVITLGSSFYRVKEYQANIKDLEKIIINIITQELKHNLFCNQLTVKYYLKSIKNKYLAKNQTFEIKDSLNELVKKSHQINPKIGFLLDINNHIHIINPDFKQYSQYIENIPTASYNRENWNCYYQDDILYVFFPINNTQSKYLGSVISIISIEQILNKLNIYASITHLKLLQTKEKDNIFTAEAVKHQTHILAEILKKIKFITLILNQDHKINNLVSLDEKILQYEVTFSTLTLKKRFLQDIFFYSIIIGILFLIFYYINSNNLLTINLPKKELNKLVNNLQNTNSSQKQFLNFMMQEIKTYINFILTGSEIIKDDIMGKASELHKRYAIAIHNNAKNILNLTNKISKDQLLINGDFTISYSTTSLLDLIYNVIKQKENLLHKKNIKLKIIDNNIKVLVLCDVQFLSQAIANILDILSQINITQAFTINIELELKIHLIIKFEQIHRVNSFPNILYQTTNKTNDTENQIILNIVKIILNAHKIEYKKFFQDDLLRIHIFIPPTNLII